MSTAVDPAADDYDLQQELRDLLCLAVVGEHLRWVLRGDDAAELVEWLGGAIAEWRSWADQVAKQLAAAGVAPDARVRSLAKDIPVNWVPAGWLGPDEGRRLVSDRIENVAQWAAYRRSQATGDSGELLELIWSGLQAQLQARRTIAAAHAHLPAHDANAANSPTTAP